jgi:hypothetical protein
MTRVNGELNINELEAVAGGARGEVVIAAAARRLPAWDDHLESLDRSTAAEVSSALSRSAHQLVLVARHRIREDILRS